MTNYLQRAYLNRTALAEHVGADKNSFQFVGFNVSNITTRFSYRPLRGAPENIEAASTATIVTSSGR